MKGYLNQECLLTTSLFLDFKLEITRQIADEITLRLQTGAATKISWTDGNKKAIDEASFDCAHRNFIRHVETIPDKIENPGQQLLLYTVPGTVLGGEHKNASPYYWLGGNRIIL